MEGKEKRVYTDDEIKRYIELLQDAKKDSQKIEEVLSFENTGLFQAYLIKIGVSPELTEYAAVVERARRKVKKILENSKECDVTENGITYKDLTERRFYAEDGKLYFEEGTFVTLPDENGKLKIVSPSNILSYVAVINRFGVLEGEYTRGGPGFSGEYSEFERKLDSSIPIAHYEETDGASYGISKDVVDYGNPADCMDQSRTLKDNYELYTRLYPRLGQWYEYYFSRYKMNLDEVSDFLIGKQEELECKPIEYEINKYLNQVCKDNHDTVELKCKLRRMVGFIKSVREKSLVGKKVADRILAKVSEELKKEREDEESKEDDITDQEKTLTKKEAAEKRLEKAKKRALNSHKKLKRYRRAVSAIEIELERIPLIGRSINRAAKRYEPKEDVDFDDGEQIQ